MPEDALFEDGAERPLRLQAEDSGDIQVISALIQDAVLPASEMKFVRGKRQFSCLINRFRWEDEAAARRGARVPERVQAVLSIADVERVRHQGLDQTVANETVLSILALAFEPGDEGTGRLILTFAGDGAIAAEVESINVMLEDVTRPYRAPSQRVPEHPA